MNRHPNPYGTIMRPCPDCGEMATSGDLKSFDRCAGCEAKRYPVPWAGVHPCPSCGSADHTLPTMTEGLGPWRCTSCSLAFDPARTAVGLSDPEREDQRC